MIQVGSLVNLHLSTPYCGVVATIIENSDIFQSHKVVCPGPCNVFWVSEEHLSFIRQCSIEELLASDDRNVRRIGLQLYEQAHIQSR